MFKELISIAFILLSVTIVSSAQSSKIDSSSLEKLRIDPQSAMGVYFSESIHPVSFQTVQPDQGFFFLGPFRRRQHQIA